MTLLRGGRRSLRPLALAIREMRHSGPGVQRSRGAAGDLVGG
jgi:hypothetical protein